MTDTDDILRKENAILDAVGARMDKALAREQELKEALNDAIAHMATHASKTGSMHGWWDVIGHLRSVRDKGQAND
jgi:hypothetical protein